MSDGDDKEVTGWTGWVAFASFFLIIDGIMQLLYGLAALFNQTWYVTTSNGAYVVNVHTWGWANIIFGVILLLSGMSLFSGNLFGRTIGMIFIVIGFLANIALIPIAPVWSIIALVLYVVSGYAVLVHGGEMKKLSM